MNATDHLHAAGQSIWLDNITRDLLSSGTLKRHIDIAALAAQLQEDGARAFVKSWKELLDGLARKAAAAGKTR